MLPLFKIWITLSATLFLSLALFSTWYWCSMPKVNFQIPLIPIFDNAQISMSHNLAPLGSTLKRQKYSLSLQLTVPSSWENHHQVGNFNIHLQIGDRQQAGFVESTQFAIVRYRSQLLRTVQTLIWMPLMIIGVVREEEKIQIHLLDSVIIAPLALSIAIKSSKLVLYKAELQFEASIGTYKRLLNRFFWPVALLSVSVIFLGLLVLIALRLLFLRIFHAQESKDQIVDKFSEEDSLFIDRLFGE